MIGDNGASPRREATDQTARNDEGGLRAPPELHGWRKAWWWFDFIILVKLARLRFIGVLVVIGVVITQWDTLTAYYNRWTRPATAAEAAASDTEYFCPMHPAIIRDNPKDKCPICFMPLSRRKKGSGDAEPLPPGIVNRVQLSPYRIALAGVQTTSVDYQPLLKEITAVGSVEFNERGQKTVSARVAGRIDKLFVNETGQLVSAGAELASFYSPDLLVTVQNLLDAHRSGNREYVSSARTRLQLLGIGDDQIDQIMASGKADTHFVIRSPISGHVITKYVREGQYVQEGMPLYDVADLSTIWIEAQVYEDDLAFLPTGYSHGMPHPGTTGLIVSATTPGFPTDPFPKLAFIYPHADRDTRTVTVRCEMANPEHKLRPGTTATVSIKVLPQDLQMLSALAADDPQRREMLQQGRVLAVPESAVIETGDQAIVYREASPGVYEGVDALLGPRMTGPLGGSYYPVLEGLQQGDQIVASGSFLVDAETRLNPAAGSIYFGGSGGSQSGTSSVTAVRPSTPANTDAKVDASLARLSPEDRKLADAQQFCPVLSGSRLGGMGVPVKVMLAGQPVFLCCAGCKQDAIDNPQETLAKTKSLKETNRSPVTR